MKDSGAKEQCSKLSLFSGQKFLDTAHLAGNFQQLGRCNVNSWVSAVPSEEIFGCILGLLLH